MTLLYKANINEEPTMKTRYRLDKDWTVLNLRHTYYCSLNSVALPTGYSRLDAVYYGNYFKSLFLSETNNWFCLLLYDLMRPKASWPSNIHIVLLSLKTRLFVFFCQRKTKRRNIYLATRCLKKSSHINVAANLVLQLAK